jgi:hypothetical protein
MNHKLELISAHGDDTFGALGYVVCGLPTVAEAEALVARGLSAQEGRASVSSSLTRAIGSATSGGRIVVIRRAAQPYLGYAAFTSAVIDRGARTVSGNPLAYAAARDELGWYIHDDVEAARKRVEQAVTATNSDQHPSLIVPGGYVAGSIEPTSSLASVLSKLQVGANALGPVELSFVEEAVSEALSFTPDFNQTSLTQLAHSLTIATAETLVLSRLRNLRWQGLALLGYSFTEGGVPVTIEVPASLDLYRQNLDQLISQLKGQSLLTAELSWLKPHVTTAVAIMHTELNNALPDESK